MTSRQSKKSKSQSDKKIFESAEVGGHSIVIREIKQEKTKALQLHLDGYKMPFVQGENSYIIGYTEAKSLMEAAKTFVECRYESTDVKGGAE